jgi:hypothetical protein
LRIPLHPKVSLLTLALILVAASAFSACGNSNDNETDIAPMIKASVVQSSPTQSDRVVFFDNVTTAGDTITLDVAVHDSTGTVDMDDADIVLRYDSTFMQLVDIRPETLLGKCGTVNPACGLTSPICVDNLPSANGGGERFCRSNGSTPCLKDADCTAANDACGDFGRFEASFAVITGPKTCSNNSARSCTTSADCHLCTSDTSIVCDDNADCTGACVASTCSGGAHNGDPCSAPIDCFDACNLTASCAGCPSKLVSGTETIVNLRFRVIDTGSSELRFVTSGSPLSVASFLRKDTVDVTGVQFWPAVDVNDPGLITGSILIEGTK